MQSCSPARNAARQRDIHQPIATRQIRAAQFSCSQFVACLLRRLRCRNPDVGVSWMPRDSGTDAGYFRPVPLLAAHRDVECNVLQRGKVEVTRFATNTCSSMNHDC